MIEENVRGSILGPGARKGSWVSHYVDHAASAAELETIRGLLDVTRYRMGVMVGLPATSHTKVYSWFSGRSRPSQVYLFRLLHIMRLKLEGYNVAGLDAEYWSRPQDSGEVWNGPSTGDNASAASGSTSS